VGAPTAATFAPLLQDAEFRRVGTGAPPAAVMVSARDIFSGRYDGQLVTLKARLLANESRQAGALKHQVLALQSGDSIFETLWEFAGTNTLTGLLKNSYLQVSGICALQLGELNQVRSFRLLLREPSDLRVLGRPPWWATLPVGRILWAAFAFGAAAGVWIWLLQRQVGQRTAQLRGEVAERRRAQTELHHALAAERELNELRSRFVSMVSHEFRTPLGVILSAAENLNAYLDRLKPEQRASQLQHIVQATRHMGNLMENVLLLGRAEAGKLDFKPAPLDLAGFCERLASQVSSVTAGRCPIYFHYGKLAAARGDEGLLRHILTNLLSNAVKYSEAGTPVEFTLEQTNCDAVFRVTDRGIGIPNADQKQLFTAFQRGGNASHLPGTGLGLVIAKHCAQVHGGRIVCESAEGVGTTFTVCLPLFGEGATGFVSSEDPN
jgi:signal transduction histidine kinase